MRYLTALLLAILLPTSLSSAQSADLMLHWEPTLNTVSGTVELNGSAYIPNQQFFFVEAAVYSEGEPAELWSPIVMPQFVPVIDSGIGAWNTSIFPDGLYQIRLHAVDINEDSTFYTLAPIAVSNDGTVSGTQPVQVLEMTHADDDEDDDDVVEIVIEMPSDGEAMAAPAMLENYLPIPVGGHVLHFDDAAKEAMISAGMTWVKWQIPFHEDGDLTVARDRIRRSHAEGLRVLLSVTGEKQALADGGDAYFDEYAHFLGEVAALGADAIEVWNEMNLDREWPTGQIDPYTYAVMLEKAYTAIKATNPDTTVITGALAPTGAEGAFGLASVWNDDRYYLGMANAGVANYADCIGVHYNEGILPPTSQGGDPRGEYPTRYLPLMLQRVAFPFRNFDIPMCMTEMGYLSPEGYGPLPQGFEWGAYTSVTEQSQWLARAIEISANYRDMPVELIIVWNIDFDSYDHDPQAGFAIIRPDGSCPACAEIAALQS